MRRIFLRNYEIKLNEIIIKDDYFHYLKTVLRMKENDLIIVNYDNLNFECKILELNTNIFIVEILNEINDDKELPFDITIGLALLKSDSFDLALMKICEFGANNILPLSTKHCVVKISEDKISKKIERFEKICLKAAIQSERLFVPNVELITKLKNIDFEYYDYVFYASERKGRNNESNDNILNNLVLNSRILLIIGPEGGFSKEEDNFLIEKCIPIKLGKRILKAETAATYFLSCLSYLYE